VKNEFDVTKELVEIGRLIDSARLIEVVRSSVHSMFRNRRLMIIGGKFAERHAAGSSKYDVVIVHDGKNAFEVVARRIRKKLPDVEITGLVNNVIGIRTVKKNGEKI